MFTILHNIDPILLSIGNIEIRWYGMMYFLTILFVGIMGTRIAKKYPKDFPNQQFFWDVLPWVVIGIVLGGKFGDVLFYHPWTLLKDPLYVFRIWEPGLAFHGGLLGVIISVLIYCRREKVSFFKAMDVGAALTPFGIFLVRVGNYINGELYGRVTNSSFGVIFPMGGPLPRHPSQLYEALAEGLIVFFILYSLYPRLKKKVGATGWLFLILYGVGRYIAECFREPDPVGFLNISPELFSMGQFFSVIMIFAGIVGYFITSHRNRLN